MKHTVDARGQACPLPVVNTKNEIKNMNPGETVDVLVDNEIAVQNLTKFARVRGHEVGAEKESENCYRVMITVGESSETQKTGSSKDKQDNRMQETPAGNKENRSPGIPAENSQDGPAEAFECCQPSRITEDVVVISSCKMGTGEEELGKALMKAFLFALTKQDHYPARILFYNSGAFLSCEDSDSLEDLKFLEAQGVEIFTCGTCLNYYGLTEKLAVGSVTNMYDIVESMNRSSKIIRP